MPSKINPALIPCITPGNIFSTLTEDTSLNIRWLESVDPVYFEVFNRPLGDLAVRQLIIAKSLDAINLRLSHQALFPFLITPQVTAGTAAQTLPVSWIWDMHVSLPAKWENIRLAKIKRISGSNTDGESGDDITGKLRLVFTGNQQGSAVEVALFQADYTIDSASNFQPQRIQIVTSAEESVVVDAAEANTIDGFLTFRTLDTTDPQISPFFLALEPPAVPTDSNGDGIYDDPSVYQMVNTSSADEYGALTHGTGKLVDSATNAVPDQDANFENWLAASNYPFRIGATRTSTNGIEIPSVLFREFDMVVPSQDEATGDVSKQNSPVWISSIERLDSLANSIKMIFSTHTIKDDGEDPDTVEFASLTLTRTMTAGEIVNIVPENDLLKSESSDEEDFRQGFGNGHVVLSSIWGSTTDEIDSFFDSFLGILTTPALAPYSKENAIISSFALSRNTRYQPTKGQFEALSGSTARLSSPSNPSDSNRYVTEGDQGLGDAIDFRTKVDFPDDLRENTDIDPIGYTGSLLTKKFSLCVDANGTDHNYSTDVLPRIRCLIGRDPIFGDIWFDGTIFKMYNGKSWQEL